VQGAAGHCLTHVEHIVGQDRDASAAVRLALSLLFFIGRYCHIRIALTIGFCLLIHRFCSQFFRIEVS
jgi:hypothetical protein